MQVLVHKWHNTSNVMAYTFSAHVPSDYIIEPSTSQPRDIGTPGAKSPQRSAAAYAAIPQSPCVVSGGHWDSSLRVVDVESGAVKQVASGHHGPVTCLSIVQSAPHPSLFSVFFLFFFSPELCGCRVVSPTPWCTEVSALAVPYACMLGVGRWVCPVGVLQMLGMQVQRTTIVAVQISSVLLVDVVSGVPILCHWFRP